MPTGNTSPILPTRRIEFFNFPHANCVANMYLRHTYLVVVKDVDFERNRWRGTCIYQVLPGIKQVRDGLCIIL